MFSTIMADAGGMIRFDMLTNATSKTHKKIIDKKCFNDKLIKSNTKLQNTTALKSLPGVYFYNTNWLLEDEYFQTGVAYI